MSDLTSLIAALEAAEGPDRLLDWDIEKTTEPNTRRHPPLYTSLIDAAVTLVPEGRSWEVRRSGFGRPAQATVWTLHGITVFHRAHCNNHGHAAIALCIAALKARQDGDG